MQKKTVILHDWPFISGLVFTLIIFGVFTWSLLLPVSANDLYFDSKWNYLRQATPNELGDTLAGLAGSLAFVWVVVAALLQARELREQRVEFKKMADSQAAQVDLLVKQSSLIVAQVDDLKSQQEDKYSEEILNNLYTVFLEGPSVVYWGSQGDTNTKFMRPSFGKKTRDEYLEDACRTLAKTLLDARKRKVADNANDNGVLIGPLENLFDDLWNRQDRLSTAQKLKLRRLGIAACMMHFHAIFASDCEGE
ncbi:hypothetical protein [Ruegeria atlantica]|uniref:hypothetical protein n=1 Tax=Ruegeria atlantica TaxID=81569 RepID=UPI0024947BAF|nr:hypothetical protein [Ruegeria atlantica]